MPHAHTLAPNRSMRSHGAVGPRVDVNRLADVAESATRRPVALVGFLLGVALTVAVVLLIVQNPRDVPLAWLAFDGDVPLWAALLGAFAAGLVVAPLLYLTTRVALTHRRDRLATIDEARA